MSKNNNLVIGASVAILAIIIFGALAFQNFGKETKTNENKSSSNSAMTMEEKMKKETETVMVGGAAMFKNKDIVSNVVNAPNLTTLVAAVKAADLVATLQSAGPFTVFGPDNGAFGKLPAGTVETLVKPENKATLTNILTYHVVSGKYLSTDLKDGQILKSVQGQDLKVTKSGNNVMINNAKISTADVLQSNGVAHVIDTVLLPEAETTNVGGAAMMRNKDIVSNVVNAPNLTTLVAAVKAADLVATLQSAGPFTVFGPDNGAFGKLPAGTVETLVKPENKATLTNILTYHVVSGKYSVGDLKDGQMLTTVQGEKITIKKSSDKVMIMDAKGGTSTIITSDVYQSNGVAHVIDTVLMPSK